MRFSKSSVFAFFLFYWSSQLAMAAPTGKPLTIGFDGLEDLAVPQAEFGVTFTGASVLACGGTLNCVPFPPFSGRNVIYDDPKLSGGVITATFDTKETGFISTVSARVTGNTAITMTAYNAGGKVLASASTGGPNFIGSGGTPNKELTVTSPSSSDSIVKVIFHDSGNTYTIDDFTFYRQKVKIVIDAGHGYIKKSEGSIQYQREPSQKRGIIEDKLTLEMALTTEIFLSNPALSGLEAGLQVVQTRRGEAAPFAPINCKPKGAAVCPEDVRARKKFAEHQEADIFVSIHTNAGAPTGNGTESFWTPIGKSFEKGIRSKELADNLFGGVVDKMGTKPRSVKTDVVSPVLTASMAASLVEVAFHSNTELASGQTITDEERLANPSFRQAAALGIAEAISKLAKKISE